MRVYLDNCCFNRPYDDQLQFGIFLETQAKLHIQDLIRAGKLELASSFMLVFENACNPHSIRRNAIRSFIESHSIVYVDETLQDTMEEKARQIMATGIKFKDAVHVACAIYAQCDMFITTDKRLLKYRTDEIRVINPTEFAVFEGGE